jgi:NAD(P)H-dependent glutamate synthase small subunit
MDCGTPFCQSNQGCPISNLIPEFNDLIYKNKWKEALQRLHLTNNFPEFTGKVCPAPCEGACTLGIIGNAVTIKNIENSIVQKGYENGWIVPNPPTARSKFKIAIIGSGPTGLAAADQLNHLGHNITVFERDDRVGGLLMYGIPNMKLGKDVVQRRVNILAQEGIEFKTGIQVGVDVTMEELNKQFDAILLATGSTKPREMEIPGKDLKGIHFAMEFLTKSTKMFLGSEVKDFIDAKDKNVIVIGAGDTSEDCIATAVRHKAASITVFARSDKLPVSRTDSNPWPQFPKVYKIEYGAQEVVATMGKLPQKYNTIAKEFVGENGKITGVATVQVKTGRSEGKTIQKEVPGSETFHKADLVLLAMGYVGPDDKMVENMNLQIKKKGELSWIKEKDFKCEGKVFTAGDCRKGQSLVVWAIEEGRKVSEKIHSFLNKQ